MSCDAIYNKGKYLGDSKMSEEVVVPFEDVAEGEVIGERKVDRVARDPRCKPTGFRDVYYIIEVYTVLVAKGTLIFKKGFDHEDSFDRENVIFKDWTETIEIRQRIKKGSLKLGPCR